MTDKVKYHKDKADYWRMCYKAAANDSGLEKLCVRMIYKHELAAKQAQQNQELIDEIRGHN